ncbi:MAG: hypothetical protein M1829_005901 [Trizodia sp. TS-e1964]|nr:MAG: hypothetical protein M1829_005901 [Trizodia sp. TS-e1964]
MNPEEQSRWDANEFFRTLANESVHAQIRLFKDRYGEDVYKNRFYHILNTKVIPWKNLQEEDSSSKSQFDRVLQTQVLPFIEQIGRPDPSPWGASTSKAKSSGSLVLGQAGAYVQDIAQDDRDIGISSSGDIQNTTIGIPSGPLDIPLRQKPAAPSLQRNPANPEYEFSDED